MSPLFWCCLFLIISLVLLICSLLPSAMYLLFLYLGKVCLSPSPPSSSSPSSSPSPPSPLIYLGIRHYNSRNWWRGSGDYQGTLSDSCTPFSAGGRWRYILCWIRSCQGALLRFHIFPDCSLLFVFFLLLLIVLTFLLFLSFLLCYHFTDFTVFTLFYYSYFLLSFLHFSYFIHEGHCPSETCGIVCGLSVISSHIKVH